MCLISLGQVKRKVGFTYEIKLFKYMNLLKSTKSNYLTPWDFTVFKYAIFLDHQIYMVSTR